VHLTTCQPRYLPDGGDVYVCVVENEQVDGTTCCDAILAQLVVRLGLRREDRFLFVRGEEFAVVAIFQFSGALVRR
jgi:hypothetical protein